MRASPSPVEFISCLLITLIAPSLLLSRWLSLPGSAQPAPSLTRSCARTLSLQPVCLGDCGGDHDDDSGAASASLADDTDDDDDR